MFSALLCDVCGVCRSSEEGDAMPSRSILVIHNSEATRDTLSRFVHSELNDVDLIPVASAEEGLKRLDERRFDLVIAAQTLKKGSGVDVYKALGESRENRDTPFLLLARTPTEEDLQTYREADVEHVLAIPFSSVDLAQRINLICDPRNWREYERVNIPGTTAVIHLPGLDVEGKVINVSHGGLLCEIPYGEQFAALFGCASIDITFPDEYDNRTVKTWADFLRMLVIRWKEENVPENLRVAWRFMDIEEEDRNAFRTILHEARARLDLSRVET